MQKERKKLLRTQYMPDTIVKARVLKSYFRSKILSH